MNDDPFLEIEKNLKTTKRWLIFAGCVQAFNFFYACYVIYLIWNKP